MNTNRLNLHLFDSFDEFAFIESLTGQRMTGLALGERLEAAGLPFSVRDPIDCAMFALVTDMVRAAFLAGYKVGRNPDLLILADQAGGDGDK